uniref:phosphopyruvate hydratase n=1 Tax=Aegilops tauschii subsp. strangulata TaxID=200361 RepID=A0A453FS52_AEGTS
MANQVGTVTEAIEAVKQAKDAHWGVMVSYRYGDTDDSFIADLIVGATTGQIKAGAPCCGECLMKYNQVSVECLLPFMWLHARKYWSKVIVPYGHSK